MKILALETSAVTASAAVTEDDRLLAQSFQNSGLTHSATLMPMVSDLLKNTGLALQDMDVIAVAAGPGSFTGVRIGVAAAKGLAWPEDKPCAPCSTLESMAYQVNDVLQAMRADSGVELAALKADGGASANNLLMQMQADISGAPVNRPMCVETTAMGAAYLAGLAAGYWSGKEDVIKNWAIDRTFTPAISGTQRTVKIKGWNRAVKCSYGWASEDGDI